ncbi:DUF6415 family natural product biosynthesis protein [Streptomyces sp. NPDC002537]
MPAYPGTAVADAGRHLPDATETVIKTILGTPAHMPLPVGRVTSSTAILRAWIRKTVVEVRNDVGVLPVDDPLRAAVEGSAEEALHRADELGPGSGLQSAFDYVRGLALVAQELCGHRERLRAAAAEEGRPC